MSLKIQIGGLKTVLTKTGKLASFECPGPADLELKSKRADEYSGDGGERDVVLLLRVSGDTGEEDIDVLPSSLTRWQQSASDVRAFIDFLTDALEGS